MLCTLCRAAKLVFAEDFRSPIDEPAIRATLIAWLTTVTAAALSPTRAPERCAHLGHSRDSIRLSLSVRPLEVRFHLGFQVSAPIVLVDERGDLSAVTVAEHHHGVGRVRRTRAQACVL